MKIKYLIPLYILQLPIYFPLFIGVLMGAFTQQTGVDAAVLILLTFAVLVFLGLFSLALSIRQRSKTFGELAIGYKIILLLGILPLLLFLFLIKSYLFDIIFCDDTCKLIRRLAPLAP